MTGQQIDRDQLRALADEYDDSTIDGGPDAAAGAIRQLLEALDQAEARNNAVRELHQPCTHDAPCRGDCAECGQHMPCDTIRALDGEQ